MKRIRVAAIVLGMTAHVITGVTFAALNSEGAATAERLNQRFHDTRTQCLSPVGPAWLCSGIMLKATIRSKDYDPWGPGADPRSSRKRGVALTWFRADSPVPWLPGKVVNGLIFFPAQQTPSNRTTLTLVPKYSHGSEVWVESWERHSPQQLPIEALFFLSGNMDGLKSAQYDQREFFKQTGIIVPVIALSLTPSYIPATMFIYDPTQQSDLGKCLRYIESAKWSDYINSRTRQKSGSQLKITPTDCGRTFPEWDVDLAYAELAREYGRGPRWKWKPDTRRDPMLRQYVCLRMNYSEQKTWNIETFRSYTDGVNARSRECNP